MKDRTRILIEATRTSIAVPKPTAQLAMDHAAFDALHGREAGHLPAERSTHSTRVRKAPMVLEGVAS